MSKEGLQKINVILLCEPGIHLVGYGSNAVLRSLPEMNLKKKNDFTHLAYTYELLG